MGADGTIFPGLYRAKNSIFDKPKRAKIEEYILNFAEEKSTYSFIV